MWMLGFVNSTQPTREGRSHPINYPDIVWDGVNSSVIDIARRLVGGVYDNDAQQKIITGFQNYLGKFTLTVTHLNL